MRCCVSAVMCELPPRARRIRCAWPHDGHGRGTTSACAENTHQRSAPALPRRNYLRVRGEYELFQTQHVGRSELPPRARRIPASVVAVACDRGTTSACAENTISEATKPFRDGNYLRVRGEYATIDAQTRFPLELPPRARRIHGVDAATGGAKGTTSACAENTLTHSHRSSRNRNYLRVRGEYFRS